MSHHLTNLTWEIELRGMQKLVLLCLAHLSTQSTCECEASVRKLAFMCGMSDSGVRDQIAALERLGRVEVFMSAGTGFFRINVAPVND